VTTAIISFLNLCAIALPLRAKLPVGLMLIARNGHGPRLLRIAAATAQLFGT
jgi:aspartyl-tRNA(Asn)/glutamyl-tRNA(Gln) amidotransferase subunit A